MSEAELTQHLHRIESESRKAVIANPKNVSDESVALIANSTDIVCSGDGYKVIEANPFACVGLTSLMDLHEIEPESKASVLANLIDMTIILSDDVTRHITNGATADLEENKVIAANEFDCGGGLSSIIDNEGAVFSNDGDNGYYGRSKRSCQLNIVEDDIKLATRLSAMDEDESIYTANITIQSKDISRPMMMDNDACANNGITDITDIIEA